MSRQRSGFACFRCERRHSSIEGVELCEQRHDREDEKRRATDPAWLEDEAAALREDLEAFAARYPDTVEIVDGKLQQKRRPR